MDNHTIPPPPEPPNFDDLKECMKDIHPFKLFKKPEDLKPGETTSEDGWSVMCLPTGKLVYVKTHIKTGENADGTEWMRETFEYKRTEDLENMREWRRIQSGARYEDENPSFLDLFKQAGSILKKIFS